MSNSVVMKLPPQEAFQNYLVEVVYTELRQFLSQAQAGQCARVSTLPKADMTLLCQKLRQADLKADILVLNETPQAVWEATSFKIIELRNAEERPLLVFIPPGTRSSANDSIDISTFLEVPLPDILGKIRQKVIEKLNQVAPDVLYNAQIILQEIKRLDNAGRYLNPETEIRYYISLEANSATDESLGGALYNFGLLPDFKLNPNLGGTASRLALNINTIETITSPRESLMVRLQSLKLQANTAQGSLYELLRHTAVSDSRAWTKRIAIESQWLHLAYDHLDWAEEVDSSKNIKLYLTKHTQLPEDDGRPVLDLKTRTDLHVYWITDPAPIHCGNLNYFRIEFVGDHGGIVEYPGIIKKPSGRSKNCSKKLSKLDKLGLEEGAAYFLRLRAYNSSHQLINDEDYRNSGGGDDQRINESGQIWITTSDGPPLDEPKTLRNQLVPSYIHAWFEASLTRYLKPNNSDEALTLRRYAWENEAKKTAGSESLFTIQFDESNIFSVPFSQTLVRVEVETLAHPEEWGRWQIDLTQLHSGVEVELHRKANTNRLMPAPLLETRRRLFEAIRTARGITIIPDDKSQAHSPAVQSPYLCSLVDLTDYTAEIIEYARAYSDWLAEIYATLHENPAQAVKLLGEDILFLELDVVEVQLPVGLNDTRQAVLLGPTHPLRLLWHLQFSLLLKDWLQRGTARNKDTAQRLINDTVRQLLNGGLRPNNLPPILLYREGSENRLLVDQGPLGFFWQVYLPVETTDTQSIRARLEQLLGLGRSNQIYEGLNKTELSRKLLRYLYQHPYVDTLKINVFNPGDAQLLADCLLELQKHYRDLKYQLRLFAEQTEGVEFGEAIDELINPQRQVSDEQDEFGTASVNPLFPKLKFSRNKVIDYLRKPEAFEAHITIFLNFYRVGVRLTTNEQVQRSSYVYGLIQDLEQSFDTQHDEVSWQQHLKPLNCPDLAAGFDLPAIIAGLLNNLQRLQGIYAEGRLLPGQAVLPVLELELGQVERRQLYLAHHYSDWVLTIDRNMGAEYFDSFLPQTNFSGTAPVYLLDHTPEYVGSSGEKLLLTTRFSSEVARLLQPSLNTFDLPTGVVYEEIYLRALRSLSGRLVLKLLSAYNQREEIVSLLLAQLFLKEYGLLENRFVIPLDAHSELFSQAQKEEWVETEISLKRTDLLLIEADPDTRIVHVRLVEVKARQSTNATMLADLGDYISQQLQNSREVLRRHFDASFSEPDRLDRAVKTRELISLLNFYLGRSVRHKLTEAAYAEKVREFILSLDRGYSLEFEGVSLLFDFSAQGITHRQHDSTHLMHHIGKDYILKLIENELGTISDSAERPKQEELLLPAIPMQNDSSFEDITAYFKPHTGSLLDQVMEERRQRKREKSIVVETGSASNSPEISGMPVTQPMASAAKPAQVETNVVSTNLGSPVEVASPKEPVVVEVTQASATVASNPIGVNSPGPKYDVLLGDNQNSPQYGILGKANGRTIALDLNGCNTISLFGVQGGGKSYTLGSIVEMATQAHPGLNQLPSPLASVIFHYNESQDYAPEFVTMVQPNTKAGEIERLFQEYGAHPSSLEDVLLLTTPDKLTERRAEFPSVAVEPIYFHSSELSLKDWKFLMSAVSNQAMYLQQMTYIMRQYRTELTLENLKKGIEEADLSNTQRKLALMRLRFAEQFINDDYHLAEKLKPGRLIIVDVRDELMEQDEALGLFVVMLNIFANAGRNFNKLVVFDEAHKYMSNRELTGHIVEVVRQMRHQGVSILIASQDPESLPEQIIELSSITVLHRFNSPSWIRHIQKSVAALADLTPSQLSSLATGEAYIWANKTTDNSFSMRAVKIRCRPRFTLHGGSTRTALNS